MVSDGGQTTTPPWQAFTQAGCNVGGVSAANIELENTSTAAAGDMTGSSVPGRPSGTRPWRIRRWRSPTSSAIAIHCAKGAELLQHAEREA